MKKLFTTNYACKHVHAKAPRMNVFYAITPPQKENGLIQTVAMLRESADTY